jgi:hypothetical protein
MNIKNQVLNLTGEKIKSLVLAEKGIQLSTQLDANTPKTEIPFDKLKNITQVSGVKELTIRYQTAFGTPAVQRIAFQKSADQQAFYQFFQKEKGFVKTDKPLSCLESTMNYWVPLVLIVLLTGFAYAKAMQMTSGEYAPPETISTTNRIFQFILEILGAGGVVCIGFGLATYCIYKGWKHYFNPPVVTKLELIKKKK